jgi:hypothetical protein
MDKKGIYQVAYYFLILVSAMIALALLGTLVIKLIYK